MTTAVAAAAQMRRSMRHRPVVLVALALLTLFVWARHHGIVAGLWMVAFVFSGAAVLGGRVVRGRAWRAGRRRARGVDGRTTAIVREHELAQFSGRPPTHRRNFAYSGWLEVSPWGFEWVPGRTGLQLGALRVGAPWNAVSRVELVRFSSRWSPMPPSAFVSFEVDGRSCAFLVELDGRIRAALEQLGVAVVTP